MDRRALFFAFPAALAGGYAAGMYLPVKGEETGLEAAERGGKYPQGRLSLTKGVAITTSDVAGAPTIYYVPSSGNSVSIYDGAEFVSGSVGNGLSLRLDSDSGHSAYHQSGCNFDAFVFDDAGTIRLGTGPSWNEGEVAGSDIARGAGEASTELEFYEGLWVNKNTITIRFGLASGDTISIRSRRATYVGSFRATEDGQTDDTQAKRLVYNAYNQVVRPLYRKEPEATWTYGVNTWRYQNNNAANRFEILAGLGGSSIDIKATGCGRGNDDSVRTFSLGVGVDSADVDHSLFSRMGTANSSALAYPETSYVGHVPLGFHFYATIERVDAVDGIWLSGADKSASNLGMVIL